MHTLAEEADLVGFFSYSREDDADSNGALSALRERIQRELRTQLGRGARDFRLWQDKAAIAPGTLWEVEIKAAVKQSVFFIPIVTPTTSRSSFCRFEFEAFIAREQEIGRSDLIFPILYVRVPELEDSARRDAQPLLTMIAERQYVDWREYRHRDVNSPQVGEAIEHFCGKIVEALHRPYETQAEKAAAVRRKRSLEDEAPRWPEEASLAEESMRQQEEARRRDDERRRAEATAIREREAAEQRMREEQIPQAIPTTTGRDATGLPQDANARINEYLASVDHRSANAGGLTNRREVFAYALAALVRYALVMAISFGGALTALYRGAYTTGGPGLVAALAFCLGAFWLALAMPVFFALRRGFGGVPAAVAGRRGAEIGAYAVAHLFVLVVANVVNSAVLSSIFVSLRQEGLGGLGYLLAFTVFLVFAALSFVLFVYIRRSFVRGAKRADG